MVWEADNARRLTVHYVFEPGEPSELGSGQGVLPLEHLHYYQCDHLGTPMALTDEDGNIAWEAHYKAWGEAKITISEAARQAQLKNPIRFQGQYFDEESGLHYNRFRYYDPVIERFLSKDPTRLAGGINLFKYSPNPIEWIDPFGFARIKNAVEGDRRHQEFNSLIKSKNPNAQIQTECY